MDEYQLRLIAVRVRSVLEHRGALLGWNFGAFPNGCCTNAAMFLGTYIRSLQDCQVTLVSGSIGNGDFLKGELHHWLEIDGVTVDITADQYSDAGPGGIVAASSPWHAQFRGVSREPLPSMSRKKRAFQDAYALMLDLLRDPAPG